MASNSGGSQSGGALWFLIRMFLLVVIVAIGIDYVLPELPGNLQIHVMKFKHDALANLLETFEKVHHK